MPSDINIPIIMIDDKICANLSFGRPIEKRLAITGHEKLSIGCPELVRAVGPDGKARALLKLEVSPDKWDSLGAKDIVWSIERGFVNQD